MNLTTAIRNAMRMGFVPIYACSATSTGTRPPTGTRAPSSHPRLLWGSHHHRRRSR